MFIDETSVKTNLTRLRGGAHSRMTLNSSENRFVLFGLSLKASASTWMHRSLKWSQETGPTAKVYPKIERIRNETEI